MIGIAQLARTVSIDFKFPEHINLGLSALTRSTKEAALLLSGSSFRSMADDALTSKPQMLAPIHSAGLGQASLNSLLSPMNISPLAMSPNYTAMQSPNATGFQQGGLNKFDATIVQMRQNAAAAAAEGSMRSPPPPIVSIPLPRE